MKRSVRKIISAMRFNRVSWGAAQFLRWVRSRRNATFSKTEASLVINSLISSAKRTGYLGSPVGYLEIGIETGNTLHSVAAETKVGVDPRPLFSTRLSSELNAEIVKSRSDDFFAGSKKRSFDFVFLDGLHTGEQTFKDFLASLEILGRGGLVLIDDVLPCDDFSKSPNQLKTLRQRFVERGRRMNWAWHGDVFRILPEIIGEKAFRVAVVSPQRGVTNTRLLVALCDAEDVAEYLRDRRDKGLTIWSENEVSLDDITDLLAKCESISISDPDCFFTRQIPAS